MASKVKLSDLRRDEHQPTVTVCLRCRIVKAGRSGQHRAKDKKMSKNNALLLAVSLGVIVLILMENQTRLERELQGSRRRVSELDGFCSSLTAERDGLRSRLTQAEQDTRAKGLRIGELESKLRQVTAAGSASKQAPA